MTSAPQSQLTLNFEPSLPEKYRTLRDFLAYRIQVQARPAKSIAGDMDMSPSMLSRKLTPGDGDTQRFNIDDLENYMQATGDTAAIEYLASKYLCSDESRRVRAIARVELLATEMGNALAALRTPT